MAPPRSIVLQLRRTVRSGVSFETESTVEPGRPVPLLRKSHAKTSPAPPVVRRRDDGTVPDASQPVAATGQASLTPPAPPPTPTPAQSRRRTRRRRHARLPSTSCDPPSPALPATRPSTDDNHAQRSAAEYMASVSAVHLSQQTGQRKVGNFVTWSVRDAFYVAFRCV